MAIKFKYSMQSILQYRESIEDTKKIILAKANTDLRDEKQKLSKLESDLEASIQKKLVKQQCNVIDEMVFINHVWRCESRIREQRGMVSRAEKKAENARKALEEATKDRKIMESLGEKEFERFVTELDAREAKELDDMVSTRFGRVQA